MIAYLKGTLLKKSPNLAVVDTGGVGYGVAIPLSTYLKLGGEGTFVTLFIHTHLSDDAISLYGFGTPEEREMFLKLIGISGIGPKLAMNILSGIESQDLAEAIRRTDVARISLVPGIGKKTALRIAMELQDKLEKKEKVLAAQGSEHREDLVSALMNMGFRRKEVERVVDLSVTTHPPKTAFEKLLRDCLQRLAKV